jgi:hypothetical protein
MKRIWIPQAIVIAMLLWALNPENPYGYYILLRCVCCAAFAYLAIKALEQAKEGWTWVLGITAVVYNPIIRIHLTRDIWEVINIATIAVAALSVFVFRPETGDPKMKKTPVANTGE